MDIPEVSNHNPGTRRPTGIDNLRDTLGRLVASYPFTQVMAMLARVCHAQATTTRQTSVDEHLAQAWDHNAHQCERAAKASQPTDATIALRSHKIGISPEEIRHRIEGLPEPLRVIAVDWAYGSLPSAGRSAALHGILRDITDRIKTTPESGEDELEARRRVA